MINQCNIELFHSFGSIRARAGQFRIRLKHGTDCIYISVNVSSKRIIPYGIYAGRPLCRIYDLSRVKSEGKNKPRHLQEILNQIVDQKPGLSAAIMECYFFLAASSFFSMASSIFFCISACFLTCSIGAFRQCSMAFLLSDFILTFN